MEIFLTRPHREVPWGFRLIGGSDSHLPIIVSKVLENSIAEKSGLEEDVLVERINNVPTTGLSHDEVNRIILATENELFFTVRRENLENLILASLNDEDNNSEITRILREAAKKDKIIEEDENSINAEDEILGFKREFGETMIIEPRINQDIKIINPNKYEQSPLYSTSLKGKKWSTFLQKPKNPPPRLKHDATIPKANQYKVIIKKQVKKEKSEPTKQESKEISEENRGENHSNILELEQSTNEQIAEIADIKEEETDYSEIQSPESEINAEDENIQEDLEVKTEQNPEEIKEVEVDEPQTNLVEESNVQDAPSLEEQLAAVQKQLRDLAQLPSSVQETLFVLTKQLADIVGEQTSTAEVNEEEIIPYNTLDDENQTEQVDQGENYDEPIEDLSETAMMEDSQSEVLSDICEEQEVPDADEEENKDDLLKNTEEELLENIDDSRKQLENEQLLQEEEQKLKKPIVRPIILPGGRKWVDPEDTQSKAKNPKISDDKINNMIETFSEVIVGKTKGINFLKYTPPPKNLDYLQRSEVYRLVHGMEPPVKGISIRSEKILAEQDYYTAGGN